MSIDGYMMDLEDEARAALLTSGALRVCAFHSDVTIRTGDDDAERHAYALATNAMKRKGMTEGFADIQGAVHDALTWAADDDECPHCMRYRDD